jgi:N-acetylglutamate synthase-like GNAT family acetyltransferase
MLLRPANEYELPLILRAAAAFDLDVQCPNYRQFMVALKENAVVGFGRIIQHSGFSELATLGVIAEEQGKGIGSQLVRALAERVHHEPLYIVTVLPIFFERLGFQASDASLVEFIPKIRFCEAFGFTPDEIKLMQLLKA